MFVNRSVLVRNLIILVLFTLPSVVLGQSFREYEKNLKLLKTNVPTSRINLDQLPGEVRYPRLVIGGEDPNATSPGSLFLANPISCIVLRDSIYICDRKQNAIIVSTMDGRLVRKIGRSGRAPGEFWNPAGIATNGDIVAVYDTQNSRVQLFDPRFSYLGSFPASFYPVFVTTLALTKNTIIVHADYGDTLLLKVRELKKPYGLIRSFLPFVVPMRDRASTINEAIFAVNKRGWICAGYVSFPYLFVFDSLGNHLHTIAIEGKTIEDLDTRSTNARVTGNGKAFWRIINALWFEDDNSIFFGRSSEIYVLRPTKQGYALQRRLSPRHKNPIRKEADDDRFVVWSIFRDKNRIYLTDTVVFSHPWVLVYDF
jgi:hypothetical protein